MATFRECKQLERELERAREEYVRENAPCVVEGCPFNNVHKAGSCSYLHYWADECSDYRA